MASAPVMTILPNQHLTPDMAATMAVLSEPDLRKLPDGRFKLLTAFACEMDDGTRFVVPTGFETDFASSRIGDIELLSTRAKNSYSAILHDWLYATGTVPKAQADSYLREGLINEGCGAWQAFKAYYAVKMFGGKAWDEWRRKSFVRVAP